MSDPPRPGTAESVVAVPPSPDAVPGPPPSEPWSMPEPRRRSPVVWIVAGAVALIALIGVVVLITRQDDGLRTQVDGGYSFDTPDGWQSFSGLQSRGSAGSAAVTTEVVGINPSNLVVVETFRLFTTVDEANLDQARQELEGLIGELLREAEGELLSGPTRVTMGGLPGFRYEITAHDLQGQLVQSRLVYVFGGATEYSLNCQHTPEHAAEIEAGCDQIMASFETSGS